METQRLNQTAENLALAEFLIAGRQPTIAALNFTASVIRLSLRTNQFVVWPGKGFMCWLHVDDASLWALRRGKWDWIFENLRAGCNLVVTEVATMEPGLAARQLQQLRKTPGIKRLAGLRRGRWREREVQHEFWVKHKRK